MMLPAKNYKPTLKFVIIRIIASCFAADTVERHFDDALYRVFQKKTTQRLRYYNLGILPYVTEYAVFSIMFTKIAYNN